MPVDSDRRNTVEEAMKHNLVPQNTRVVVADDDRISLEILSMVVRTGGYRVETAANGLDAWEKIRCSGARLVVSDWDMPGMDGLELCRRIRTELPHYVYVILVTGHSGPEDLIEGLSAGADEFLSKPVNPAELRVRLRTAERILALEMREITIFALAKLAESRDPDTGLHIERIQAFCRALATRMAAMPEFESIVDDEFIRTIEATSPLHDIGKIGIPDAVLLKPGRLSDEEFAIMKTHAAIGGQTLDAALDRYPNAQYLVMARDIAMHHHERYDGKGYPAGLRGNQIPLSARITSLADVYDALMLKRAYKDAYNHMVARNIILEGRGTQFDPAVVDAFVLCESEFPEIRQRIAAQETTISPFAMEA